MQNQCNAGRDFLREWAFPQDTVMAEALAHHFNDSNWLHEDKEKKNVSYVASTELQDFININCSQGVWHGSFSSSCSEEMKKLERVYITHRYLLQKFKVPIMWTETQNPSENCDTLSKNFPKNISVAMDEFRKCCDTFREWPISNEVHDFMWSPRNKQNWLLKHSNWLHDQCSVQAARALMRIIPRDLSSLLV